MANSRGRGRATMGGFLTPYMVDGKVGPGQPTILRTWGIPTGPGYRIGPGKWNVLVPPLILELARQFVEIWRQWKA